MTWIELLDTAIKIGLGASIAAISSYITLRETKKYEYNKRKEERFYKNQDERKMAYVQFSSKSHILLRKYDFKSCDPWNEDYAEYLDLFNKIQILSEESVRSASLNTFNSVTQHIILNKSSSEFDAKDINKLRDNLNAEAKKSIAFFQKVAQQDVVKT